MAIGERIEAIERPKAEERRTANLPNQTGKLPVQEPPARVRDAVAQAIGGMSGRTYEKAKVVVAAAEARLCGNFPRRGRQVTHRKS